MKKTLSLAKEEPLISQLVIPDRAAETVSPAPTSTGLTSGGSGRHMGTGNEGRKQEVGPAIKGRTQNTPGQTPLMTIRSVRHTLSICRALDFTLRTT